MLETDGRNYTVFVGVLAFSVLGLLATVHDNLIPLFFVGVAVLIGTLVLSERTM